MHQTQFSTIEARGQGKVSDPKILSHTPGPKVYPHIEFSIPTSNNIGDMLWTRIRLGQTEGCMDGQTVQKLYAPRAHFGCIKM